MMMFVRENDGGGARDIVEERNESGVTKPSLSLTAEEDERVAALGVVATVGEDEVMGADVIAVEDDELAQVLSADARDEVAAESACDSACDDETVECDADCCSGADVIEFKGDVHVLLEAEVGSEIDVFASGNAGLALMLLLLLLFLLVVRERNESAVIKSEEGSWFVVIGCVTVGNAYGGVLEEDENECNDDECERLGD